MTEHVRGEMSANGVLTLTLNRPEKKERADARDV